MGKPCMEFFNTSPRKFRCLEMMASYTMAKFKVHHGHYDLSQACASSRCSNDNYCSSISSMFPLCSSIKSAQFIIDVGHDSNSSSDSSDSSHVDPSSSSDEYCTSQSRQLEIMRPGNPSTPSSYLPRTCFFCDVRFN
mmetsp:Transcript_1647/g.3135  ORF Transcript_1647/g.3135 Transcript_1647/m.3135 type:complete len:137 (-) Transcript_1647:178-588(-)